MNDTTGVPHNVAARDGIAVHRVLIAIRPPPWSKPEVQIHSDDQ